MDSKQSIQEILCGSYMPGNLPDAVLDENVDIHLFRQQYFSSDAWLDVVQRKRRNYVYK